MFRVFKNVRIEFDFHARDIETGDAIVCSEDVVPSPKFSEIIKISFDDFIKDPEDLLVKLSRDRDHELTIYLKTEDFIYFLSLYLKSTLLEIDDEYVFETYLESLSRLHELDNTLLKPSSLFRKGIFEALNFQREIVFEIIKTAPTVNYLDSFKNLPLEILLAHFFKTGEVQGDLSELVLELCHIHLITLHDAMVMAGLISDDIKPYTDLEQHKRQEMCEPQDCKCASSDSIYQAKTGKEPIWIVDYAKRKNNPW